MKRSNRTLISLSLNVKNVRGCQSLCCCFLFLAAGLLCFYVSRVFCSPKINFQLNQQQLRMQAKFNIIIQMTVEKKNTEDDESTTQRIACF